MAKGKRKPGLRLWAAVWDEVSFTDPKKRSEVGTFTVAATKREAVQTMADGLLGVPGIEGSATRPKKVWRVPADDVGAMKGYTHYLLNLAYWFVPPHRIMTHDDVADIVGRLASR